MELERTRNALQSTKRQCEVVKELLSDATRENDCLYDAFNEELDATFNNVNLPPDEAWSAMANDLRRAMEERNNLTRENTYGVLFFDL